MNLNTRTSVIFFGRTKMNVCIALLKKRFLYFISMMLMIGITQFGFGQCIVSPNSTQLFSVGEGTIFSINSGTIVKADQLIIQPSLNFILTNNSLTRNQTITNPLTLNSIKRVYKFENTSDLYNGSLLYDYQLCELNGNNPSKLTFGLHNGFNWGFYASSVNKFPEYSVSKTFSPAVSINEMTLGYCDPSTAAVLSGDTSICGYGIGVASLKVNITGGVGNYTIVLNDGSKDTTINNYYNGSNIRIRANETKTYSLVSVRGSGGCYGTGNSGTATITVFGPLNSGSISTTGETICYGGNPATIPSVTDASGGDGNYKYSWFASPGGFDPGVDVSKAYLDNITGLEYTKTFVRWVEDGCSVNAIPSQGSYTVTVLRKFTPGSLEQRDQLICAGQIPDPIMGRLPGAIGGDENITYKWQYRDGTAGGDANGWKDIPNSNVVNYIPTEGLTISTTYRRLGKDGTCVTDFLDESTVVNGVVVPAVYVNVNIKAPINPGSISSSPQEICYNTVPATINNLNLPSGADYYQYKWQANGVDINISQESYSQNSLRLTETTTFTLLLNP